MNREQRKQLAIQTLAMIESGGYEPNPFHWVDLNKYAKKGIEQARLMSPSDCESLCAQSYQTRFGRTKIVVSNETTIKGAQVMLDEQPGQIPLCLNFASAKSPWGGFLSGSQAQEESIARISTLYSTLMECISYYEINRKNKSPLYTNHAILSPRVCVFRSEDGGLLGNPYEIAVLTAPAPNAGAARRRLISNEQIHRVMIQRIENVLSIAAANGYTSLVLGAWGCGVFKNNPQDVARGFRTILTNKFEGVFESVRFSVLDQHPDRKFIGPFEAEFMVQTVTSS